MGFKLLFCALFCAISAFAQFNSLRGPAYNPYGTLGAAPTIADLIAKPSDIYGHKFIYVAPIDYTGASAFDLAGGSAFLVFGNSIILGYAKNSWGLALNWNPNKLWKSYESYTYDDNMGLNVSFAFKNFTVYGQTNWYTNDIEIREDNSFGNGSYSAKNALLGITGGNKFIWDAAIDLTQVKNDTKALNYMEDDILDSEFDFTSTSAKIQFNFGYKALQNDRARFIVGLNNSFAWNFSEQYIYARSYYNDDDWDWKLDSYSLSLDICPSILGEVVLTKHLLAFIAADYGIYIDDLEGIVLSIKRKPAYSRFGLRYERDNWAVETSLRNVFEEGYEGKNPFINLGGFIYF